MNKLVLIRHGQSTWNKANKFTGWVDVPLTEQGILEAQQAGQMLKDEGITPDVLFTSLLRRAIHTSSIVLETLDRQWIPVQRTWRLNERHYGELAGLDKQETIEKYGEEQVMAWRRSYSLRPPLNPDTVELRNDPKYMEVATSDLPRGESLQDVEARLLPYWKQQVIPEIMSGKTTLIAAHGNSLRALVKGLEGLGDNEVAALEIPTGEPGIYYFDDAMNVVDRKILLK